MRHRAPDPNPKPNPRRADPRADRSATHTPEPRPDSPWLLTVDYYVEELYTLLASLGLGGERCLGLGGIDQAMEQK